MYRAQEGVGEWGARVPGPPWILGWRGAPREAPENTRASFELAIALGLDGVHYPVRSCRSGELVVLADPTLDRTTDAGGLLAARTLPELAGIDAGGWFGKAFLGAALPLLDEQIVLPGNQAGAFPQHVIELVEPGLYEDVVRVLERRSEHLSLRLASTQRGVCKALQHAGFDAMLLAREPSVDDLAFARDERLTAIGARSWDGGASAGDCRSERWCIHADRPDELLRACRAPVHGLTTSEPRRALAIRALVHLTPHDAGPYPLSAPTLEVDVDPRARGAAWIGAWSPRAAVRNPFGFPVRVECDLWVRRGVFECEGLPHARKLAPGESFELDFHVRGGSWSPGGDPSLVARFSWSGGPGRPGESLTLDAPLERVRSMRLGARAERLTMLAETPDDPPASLTARRHARHLFLAIENPGGLEHPELVAQLDGVHFHGGRSLRIALPTDFDDRAEGVAFSAGLVGRAARGARIRRWAGGVPASVDAGAAGRLMPGARA